MIVYDAADRQTGKSWKTIGQIYSSKKLGEEFSAPIFTLEYL